MNIIFSIETLGYDHCSNQCKPPVRVLPHQVSRRRWQSCCPWAVIRLWSHRMERRNVVSSGGQVLYVKTSETMTLSGSKRSAWGLDLLGCLHAVSIAILLTSVHVAKGSHSTGASSISSLGFGWPVISSLLGVEATTTLSVLSLLLVEVRSSCKSTDAMGMHVLLTSRGCSSLQHKKSTLVYLSRDQSRLALLTIFLCE